MLRLPLYDAQICSGVVTSDQTKRTPNKPHKTHESVRYTMVSMVKGHTAQWGGMSVSVHCTLKISSPEVCSECRRINYCQPFDSKTAGWCHMCVPSTMTHPSSGPPGGPKCSRLHGQPSEGSSRATPQEQKPPHRGAYFHGSATKRSRLVRSLNQN